MTDIVTCPECNGKGCTSKDQDCPVCHGTGVVSIYKV